MSEQLDTVIKALDGKRRTAKNGCEYWLGRDIQEVLNYSSWAKFENVINRAKLACESAGGEPTHHFAQTGKMIQAGKGAEIERRDYFLSRYACYLIAMNGDTAKPEIATAQTYFAVQTRRQELQDKLTTDERRLQLRERVRFRRAPRNLHFETLGISEHQPVSRLRPDFCWLMGLPSIKGRKGVRSNEDLLDRAGRTELAANEFRITQTEEKLVRDRINSEPAAIMTHREVGAAVRNAINKLGGTMPENLPAEPPIKLLEKKKRDAIKADDASRIEESDPTP